MTKEFNLSEKRKQLKENYVLRFPQLWAAVEECNKQDKEFIKRLKEELKKKPLNNWEQQDNVERIVFDVIDNLAGEELAGGGK